MTNYKRMHLEKKVRANNRFRTVWIIWASIWFAYSIGSIPTTTDIWWTVATIIINGFGIILSLLIEYPEELELEKLED